MRKPTIYEALQAKLGRKPTAAELKDDVRRILTEASVERATRGKLRHQAKRRRRANPDLVRTTPTTVPTTAELLAAWEASRNNT